MKYVYPCLVTQLFSETKLNAGYLAFIPDFDNQTVYGDDLFEVIKEAQNALAINLYVTESNNKKIPVASDYKGFVLESNQYLTYLFCDTENFSSIFELYDQLNEDDLLNYLKEQNEIIQNKVLPNVSLSPIKKKKHKGARIESSEDIDFDIEYSELEEVVSSDEQNEVPTQHEVTTESHESANTARNANIARNRDRVARKRQHSK